ncbi:Inactive leucine-rich repeat receptor-like serine/threonine-protein kinase [Zea mays]|uniref:Inactive leucine-rich repeat receptor-like serine/threonine-protein kinase n=1 Tax=Zea mays TaxID=4577 RepID=A0A3L6EP58_MAIZE|nr:Inactive leucine-rich repeat receptor-like serine/threonine-protein kinase [Zea mays]
MPRRAGAAWPCFLLLHIIAHLHLAVNAADADALLTFKSSLDRSDRLPWRPDTAPAFCASWPGVRQCAPAGRVTKLVLEGLNLTGSLTAALLAPLAELRVLSLKSNALTGPIPEALPRALPNLKLLYLADNRLQGRVPPPSPCSTGPPSSSLRQPTHGPDPALPRRPATPDLAALDATCSPAPCRRWRSARSGRSTSRPTACRGRSRARSPPGVVVLAILVAAALMASRRGRNKRVAGDVDKGNAGTVAAEAEHQTAQAQQQHIHASSAAPAATTAGGVGGREFSWEREGIGKLVFCGGVAEMYSLEELLRASAETLGRGEAKEERLLVYDYYPNGSLFSLVHDHIEDTQADPASQGHGFLVTSLTMDCDGRTIKKSMSLSWSGLAWVALPSSHGSAVQCSYPKGPFGPLPLFVAVWLWQAGRSRPSSKGKPLHWTSCMKIAEDVAAGLVHLHQWSIVHGNLKPSNVLLGPDFESCLTDYGLLPTLLPSNAELHSSSSLFYRAPEVRGAHATSLELFTPATDVYSFGVLLLELLTGRTPFQDLMELHGDDIPSWVRAVREEERETESVSAGGGGAEEKLTALINIAATCVAADPARRPTTAELLRMVREARAEAMSSSNSSDRSPARWSDAMLGVPLPRDQAAESFTDRERLD